MERFITDLKNKLLKSCQETISCLNEIINEEIVCGFVFYCTSGCTSIGLAICTTESIARKIARTKMDRKYVWLNAFEWEYLCINDDAFQDIDDFIETSHDDFYNSDLDDDKIETFFINAFSQTIIELKNLFNDKSRFDDQLLLGVQFSDPSEKGLEMIERVSERVNTDEIHKMIVDNDNQLRRYS